MTGVLKKQSVTPASSGFQQIVLWVGANAGGVGKSTLSIHVGYEMARRGYDTVILDLDTNVSGSIFMGLPQQVKPEDTLAAVFDESFEGDWPLVTPSWGTPKGKLQICRGGLVMVQVGMELVRRERREYALKDVLEDNPLPHRLIILDCPASLNEMSDVALTASTHLIIPVKLNQKSFVGANQLLTWYRAKCKRLRLDPPPEVLGFMPMMYNKKEALERVHFEELEQILPTGYHCYPHTQYSSEFKNASHEGKPLHVYRPGHKYCEPFDALCNDLVKRLRGV